MIKGLIFYGTLTGNTEMAATVLHQKLAGTLPAHKLDLRNVREVTAEQIVAYDYAIFGTSTWDDFGNPDAEEFFEVLGKAQPDFSKITFALFGLGDSSYHDFCGATILAKKALAARHALVYEKIFTIDGYPEQEHLDGLIAWAKAFITHEIEPGQKM